MIKLIAGIVTLFALLFMGSTWVGEKGYVLIAFNEWTIETSVVAACIMLLAAYACLHIIVILFKGLLKIRSTTKAWRSKRKQTQIQTQIQHSLTALFQRNFTLAEKLSLQKLHVEAGTEKASVTEQAISKTQYLIAAEAAKQQNDFEKYSRYKLRGSEFGSEYEKQLAMAESLQAEGKIDKAIASVTELLKQQPKHGLTLATLAALYQNNQQASALAELLPKVKRYSHLPDVIYHDLIQAAYQILYAEYAVAKDIKSIQKAHKAIINLTAEHAQFDALYLNALIDSGHAKEAENYLIKAVKSGVSTHLLNCIKKLNLVQPARLITLLEQKIKQTHDDYVLLAALGYVAFAAREWDLAKKALEQALKYQKQPQSEDYYHLGQVLEQLKMPEQAMACYRKGLNV